VNPGPDGPSLDDSVSFAVADWSARSVTLKSDVDDIHGLLSTTASNLRAISWGTVKVGA
jgi:hypothetical protein